MIKPIFAGTFRRRAAAQFGSVAQCLALNFISARSFTVMRKNTVCCCRLSKRGFARGEKVFHIVDPARRDEHLRRLASAGIDVTAIRQRGQFELRTWTDTHLCNGRFDQEKTLALFQEVVRDAKQQGFPLIRFVTHMEWALENRPGVDDLLEYEARANYIWLRQDGPVNPVICTYDLTKFGGDLVVDVMRTHPMIIIGGILQRNSFFVPPDEFLKELRERRGPG